MAFVVTAGQIQSVQRPDANWSTSLPAHVQLTSLSMTYEAMWRSQPALRTVTGFLARNVAQLGCDVYERLSATDRRKAVEHPIARLLERPVPNGKWTKYRLLSTVMHDLCIYDNAYLLMMRNADGLAALLPIPPRMVAPRGGTWFAPEQYRITGSAGYRDVPAAEVVHIHGYNPSDPRRGVSPIETLRQILAEEYAASQWREQLWRNGARVNGYIKRPPSAPPWSPTARERFKSDWSAQYSGDGPSAGGTAVLEDGMEFVPSGVSPRDAQYVEARKLTREEVATAFHVSPVMVGVMDGATFSNVTELHKMLYQDTLPPYLAQISQDLENQLLEVVDPSAAGGRLYVEFNLSEKLRGSFSEQTQALQSAVGAPWMTRAEARAMLNLPDLDGSADELIVPLNVIEGGLASARDTAPDNPGNEYTPKSATGVLRRLRERQRKTVLTELGAGRFTGLDVPRWNRELVADLAAAGLGGPDTAALAARTNEAVARLLGAALSDAADPKTAAHRVFDGLTEETACI